MRSFQPCHRLRCRRAAVARMVWLLIIALPVVQSGCALIVIHDRPVFDQNSVEPPSSTTPPPPDALALVQAGVALDKKHPEWAITYYRDAALKALPYILGEEFSTKLEIETATGAQGTYRRAIEYALETSHRQALIEGISWTEFLARCGVGVQGRVGLYEAARWEEALPTRRFQVQGFRHQAGRGGIGAPLVMCLTRSGKWGEPATETTGALTEPCEAHFPKTLYRAASAILRPGSSPGEPLAVLELHDPVLEPAMRWRSEPNAPAIPLAYDMTVPLARQFHVANLNLLALSASFFLRSTTAELGSTCWTRMSRERSPWFSCTGSCPVPKPGTTP